MQDDQSVVTIHDVDELYRRLTPIWRKYYKDNGRLSSAAFRPRKGSSLSVDLARLTTPERCLSAYDDCGLSSLVVADVRSQSLEVQYTPLAENTAHCDVVGEFTKATAKRLAAKAQVLVE